MAAGRGAAAGRTAANAPAKGGAEAAPGVPPEGPAEPPRGPARKGAAGRAAPQAQRPVLVLNAGSSSLKYALFAPDLAPLTGGIVEIGAEGGAPEGSETGENGAEGSGTRARDHAEALGRVFASLEAAGHPPESLAAAAHRVVHGGAALTRPCALTPPVIAAIRAAAPLAPLHNPANLAGIEAIAARAPALPQFASFDTAFHATNPPEATTCALPARWREAGVRRYGFHGLSYAALVAEMAARAPLPRRLLAFHLGNGASACAILEGRSVATTMGYSPLSGLAGGTRAGDLDPAAVLRLAEELGSPRAALSLLNGASGLLGLSGESGDMRALLASGSGAARFAVEHFCYWAARHGGSLIAAMGGLDAIAFTGGIGENAAPVRAAIVRRLEWAGAGAGNVHVIAAREERQIAREALCLMAGRAGGGG